MLRATIPGSAPTKGSRWDFKHPKTGQHITTDDSRSLGVWTERAVAAMQREAPAAPIDDPLFLCCTVYRRRPKGHYGSGRNAGRLKPGLPEFPPIGNDVDKVLRACFDACKLARWVSDDVRFAGALPMRLWDDGRGERIELVAVPMGAMWRRLMCAAVLG